MSAAEIWGKLSKINCQEHVEQKGQFSYLSWTWAWAMVKQEYPTAIYELLPDITFPDGTMEVRVRVTIFDLSHDMWLPVLDFKNKPVSNPNAFDINASRMRCLVKCLAMFGLGHYIYAGESVPSPKSTKEWVMELSDSIKVIKGGLESGDYYKAAEAWFELTADEKSGLWVAPTKDKFAPFTTREREIMQSSEFRKSYYGEDAA